MSSRYTVTCPTCGAKPHETCRTLVTHRVTDTHASRLDAQYLPHLRRRGIRVNRPDLGDEE